VGVAGAGLFERDDELAELLAAIDLAEAGEGSLTVLEGVAGIGKTSLLKAVMENARSRGLQVLAGRGAELELEFSFGVARQLFELLLRGCSEPERAALVEGAAALAGPLFGLPGEPSVVAGADSPFAMYNALYWLTANVAEDRPLLLVIDDLHWADTSSLRWLNFLTARIEDLPVALIVAFRPELQRSEIEQLTIDNSSLPLAILRPAPLTITSSSELTRQSLGTESAPEFCQACHSATGGNPFLLRELLASLKDTGVRPSAQSVAAIGEYRSDTVGRWVLARLARLGPDALALATAVCILGVEVPLRRAAALAELEHRRAGEAADQLSRAEILQHGRPLTFVHAIISAAVHEQLAHGERARLHKQAARILAAEGSSAEEIAAHLLVTEPAAEDAVVTQLRSAAEEARARGAPESVAAYLSRALDEPAAEDLRSSLLHELGLATFLAHDPSALDHLSAAHDLAKDSRSRAEIALDLARSLLVVDQPDGVLALLEGAVEELGDLDEELAALLEVWLIFTARIWLDHSRVYHEHIERLRKEPLEDTAVGRQRMCLLIDASIGEDQDPEVAFALAKRAYAGGKLLEEMGPASPPFYLATFALAANSLELSTLWCDAAIKEARRLGSPIGFGLASCSRAMWMFLRGALAEAEADARAGLASGVIGSGLEGFNVLALSSVLLERGEIEEAEQVVFSVGERCERLDYWTNTWGVCARGRVRIAKGDLRGGLDDLTACAKWAETFGVSAWRWIPWMLDAAVAHEALGEHQEALALAQRELRLSRQVGVPHLLGVALRTYGLIEGDMELLREAVTVLDGSEARLEFARALVDLGAALRRAGHRTDARSPLSQGMDLADRCGASVLAERARQELLAAGARPRRHRVSGAESLTASERRIAMMANEGMTNREIAQALFVTGRTVSSHLTHVYQKLSITGRAQLAEAFRS
jgi:DNA-binding CsgD family transcriptional regulator